MYLSLILLLGLKFANAAPHPATATSVFISDPKNYWMMSSFIYLPTPRFFEITSTQQTELQNQITWKKVDSDFFIHLNSTNKESNIKNWKAEYAMYGFEILGSKNIIADQKKVLLFDLTHKKNNKSQRQVIWNEKGKRSVLTCISDSKKFNLLIKDCNQFIENLKFIN